LLVGCGRIGFDDVAETPRDGGDVPSPDAVVDAAQTEDADLDPDADVASQVFDTPTAITELSQPGFNIDDPTLTGDMLEIFFKSDEGATLDIYTSTRATISDAWASPFSVAEINTNKIENTPEVSADGLTLYFSSNRDGDIDLYESTRASRSLPWGAPVRQSELSSSDPDFAAARDALERSVVTTRITAANVDLYIASRASKDDPWSTPVPLTNINTVNRESDAVLDITGLHMYYTADGDGTSQREIFYSQRASTSDSFGPGTQVSELSTPEHDEDPWISPDLQFIYFSRSSPTGNQLYVAKRAP